MTRSLCAVAAVLAVGSIAGCKVDDRTLMASDTINDAGAGATGIMLGTFENDTASPEDRRFATYQYYSYNPSIPDLPAGAFVSSPLVAPGYNSNFALGLDWEVIDVPDGTPNYPGVGVRTVVSTGFVDLSSYDRIVFAQRYQHTDLCQPLQNLTVSIGCDELNTGFSASVPVSETWTNTVIPFSIFTEPSYAPASGHTLAQCLALANSVVFQAQVNLSDGDCASGNLSLDNIEIRAGGAPGDGGQPDATPSAGIAITPDQNGYFDGSNAAGVVGPWFSTGDDYASDGTPGLGSCPLDGFSAAQCSTINTPAMGTPFVPDPTGRGMCTSGTVAKVITDATGQPAYSAIWGNLIGFDLSMPAATPLDGGPDGGVASAGVYDAVAHGITGFAFDLDSNVTGMRVEFTTEDNPYDPSYWQGAAQDVSPVSTPGHYEIRWADVGGPYYDSAAPPFDPSRLQGIRFHIRTAAASAIPYSYCIKNFVMLTGP